MDGHQIVESDLNGISKDAMLRLFRSQASKYIKSSEYTWAIDGRLGEDKLRKTLLDPRFNFTMNTSLVAAANQPSSLVPFTTKNALSSSLPIASSNSHPSTTKGTGITQPPQGVEKKLIVLLIDARLNREFRRAYTFSHVHAFSSRVGCQPGDWNIEAKLLMDVLKAEPGAATIIDGPFRLSTPLVDDDTFFEDFFVDGTFRQDLLRVPHSGRITLKVEDVQLTTDIKALTSHLNGLKRKALSRSGATTDTNDVTSSVSSVDEDRDNKSDADGSVYPLLQAQILQASSPPRKKQRGERRSHGSVETSLQGDKKFDEDDIRLSETLRELLRQRLGYSIYNRHRGRVKSTNGQFVFVWKWAVDFCKEYYKHTLTGHSTSIDYKHIYGALGCSETWRRDARNTVEMLDVYGPDGTDPNQDVIALLDEKEISKEGRKGIISMLKSAALADKQ